jgi:hypothetical protein
VLICAGIDGLVYQHSAEKFDNTQLRKDLEEMMPTFIEDLKKKYGDEGVAMFDLASIDMSEIKPS